MMQELLGSSPNKCESHNEFDYSPIKDAASDSSASREPKSPKQVSKENEQKVRQQQQKEQQRQQQQQQRSEEQNQKQAKDQRQKYQEQSQQQHQQQQQLQQHQQQQQQQLKSQGMQQQQQLNSADLNQQQRQQQQPILDPNQPQIPNGQLKVERDSDGFYKFRREKQQNMHFLTNIWQPRGGPLPDSFWSQIKKLEVDTKGFTPDQVTRVFQFTSIAASKGVRLNDFWIRAEKLTDEQCDLALKLVPRIRWLRFVGCHLIGRFIESIVGEISGCDRLILERINFVYCKLDEKRVMQLSECIKYLRGFYIGDNKVTLKCMRHIAELILENRQAKSPPFDFLGLYKCSIDDQCLKEISRFIPLIKCTSLNICDSHGKITSTGVSYVTQMIAETAEKNPRGYKLETLFLKIDVGDADLLKQFSKCMPWVPNLALSYDGKLQKKYMAIIANEVKDVKRKTKHNRLKCAWVRRQEMESWRQVFYKVIGEHLVEFREHNVKMM